MDNDNQREDSTQTPFARKSLKHVNSFKAMDVMRRASELESSGRKIVHLEVGEPDFPTVAPIVDAAKKALDKGLTQYTSPTGIVDLKSRLSELYSRRHGLSVNPERILVTPGASGGLLLLANLLVEAGDEILITDPAYPCVRNFIRLMSATPRLIPVDAHQNFRPTVSQLEKANNSSTKGIWLASPNNPTGTVLDRETLTKLAVWARASSNHFLVDEIYHGLHYVSDLPSALEVESEAFVVNSFSKYFGMTGWRLGWIVVPDEYVEQATRLAQNLYICAPSVSQYGALGAFTPDAEILLENRRHEFNQRRGYFCNALSEIGLPPAASVDGAFYVYADISRYSDNSQSFCQLMLEKYGVAMTPGSDFGEYKSNQYVRMSFTTSKENLELAIERLQLALESFE